PARALGGRSARGPGPPSRRARVALGEGPRSAGGSRFRAGGARVAARGDDRGTARGRGASSGRAQVALGEASRSRGGSRPRGGGAGGARLEARNDDPGRT